MLGIILHGIGAGIIFSFLTGPVFFAMIKTSIEKGFPAGFSLAIGVIISDSIFIALTIFSSFLVSYDIKYARYIGAIGGLFLLGVGLFYILKRINVQFEIQDQPRIRKRGYLFKGFFMSLLSPTTLMFWIMVGGIVTSQLGYNTQQKFWFFLIALTTQLTVDFAKTFYAAKLRYRIKPSSIQLLNRIAGAIIIVFALRLLYDAAVKFIR